MNPRGRNLVIGIIACVFAVAALAVGALLVGGRPFDPGLHLLPFFFLGVLFLKLYQGSAVARWLLILLLGGSGLVLVAVVFRVQPASRNVFFPALMAAVYIASAAFLMFSRDIRQFQASQKSPTSSTETSA